MKKKEKINLILIEGDFYDGDEHTDRLAVIVYRGGRWADKTFDPYDYVTMLSESMPFSEIGQLRNIYDCATGSFDEKEARLEMAKVCDAGGFVFDPGDV